MAFRKVWLAAGAALALTTQPLAAQDEEQQAKDDAAMLEALKGMFTAEPLTEEQEARLPLAGRLVEKMMPPGSMGEMMDSMMSGMLGPIMDMATSNPEGDVARQLGMDASELELTEEEAVELADMLDPEWRERNRRMAEIFPSIMNDMMSAMEPTMRKAMTELYAINFTESELTEIDAFFSTPTGASFARKNFSMSSDPRIMAASMEALPQMMGAFADMESKMDAATADLPAPRGWDDLDAEARARIAQLTGLEESQVQENMEYAAMAEEAMEDDSEYAVEAEADIEE